MWSPNRTLCGAAVSITWSCEAAEFNQKGTFLGLMLINMPNKSNYFVSLEIKIQNENLGKTSAAS